MPELTDLLNDNPLLDTAGLPRYDKIDPVHVIPASEVVLQEAEAQLAALESNIIPTWDGTVTPLDACGRRFQWARSPVSHLLGVKNSNELRDSWEAVRPQYVAFFLRAGQSKPIYQALKQIREGNEWNNLDGAQRRIISNKLRDMELAGIGLEDDKRQRFNEIADELSKLSTDFSNHVLDAVKAYSLIVRDPDKMVGMPQSTLELAAQSYAAVKEASEPTPTAASGPWKFTLDIPSWLPFMRHCHDAELREQMYRAYATQASEGELDNSPLIEQILKLRKEQAGLLGFDTYAEMSLTQTMAGTVGAVHEMFTTLRNASWEPANAELNEVRALAESEGHGELKLWDVTFWSERLREKRFEYTDEELRPYFSLERVLDGFFALVERLFAIRIQAADGEAPVWHEDVRFFHVHDTDGTHIASFYLDPYSRPENKQGGAWMADCIDRRVINGDVELPVAHLVCNSTPPVGDTPSLMTFREVETLFHEFGHGLQHMLTTVDYADAAGITGVEWDAVELPSQFMENWCYHKPTLLGMAKHYKTGETLPEDLFEKICKARTFQAGMLMIRQLNLGMTDMALHHEYDPDGNESYLDVQNRIAQLTVLIPRLPEDRSLCSFRHIFAGGYAAGYYSYKWAEVLSADAFSAFEEAGLDNDTAVQDTGRRFRNTVLSEGGGRHPMEIFKDFRGREPSPEALLRHNGLLSG